MTSVYLNGHSVSYAPIGQSVAVYGIPDPSGAADGGRGGVPVGIQYTAGTHTFLAPELKVSLDEPEPGVYDDDINLSFIPLDVPHWKSLSGITIIILFTMILVSLIICLARADFNLVFYIIGYLVWCVEPEASAQRILVPMVGTKEAQYPQTQSLVLATRKTYKQIRNFTILIGIAILLDTIWLLVAFNSWICSLDDYDEGFATSVLSRSALRSACLNTEATRLLWLTHGMHQVALVASFVNWILKIVFAVTSMLWLRQQALHRKKLAS